MLMNKMFPRYNIQVGYRGKSITKLAHCTSYLPFINGWYWQVYKYSRKGYQIIYLGHRTLQNICDIYKGDNINNKSTRLDDVYNGKEGENHSFVYQTIIKIHIIVQTFNNIINPLEIDIKYIRHTYDLHRYVGLEF